ncbi:MAG: Tad domain-containing protein [bacterium]
MRSIESWRIRHRDENGAVFLLSLAAILIIMMLAWVIIDAGSGARDKIELQASADTAAFSQASVKARAANMIAYANVAKRSIIAIQSMYMGMYYGYVLWVAWRWSKCKWYRPDICIDAAINTAMLAVETIGDFHDLTGSYILGLFGSGGASKSYHARDIKALDNYQRYMMWLGPWWAYSEGVVRGMRNGATTTASFPVPPGTMIGPIPNIMNMLKTAMAGAGLGGLFAGSNVIDRMPYKRGSYWGDLFWDHMLGDGAYMVEHLANSLHHKNRSSMGAKTSRAYGYGMLAFPLGFTWVTSELNDEGKPMVFQKFNKTADWNTATSSLVFAYGNRPEKFFGRSSKIHVHVEGIQQSARRARCLWVPHDG